MDEFYKRRATSLDNAQWEKYVNDLRLQIAHTYSDPPDWDRVLKQLQEAHDTFHGG